MQIEVTTKFPDVLLSVSVFGLRGSHSKSGVSWICHTQHICQSAFSQMGDGRDLVWTGRASVKPRFITVYPLCLQHHHHPPPPKKGHWLKQAKHSNLLRARPSLYLAPAFQQCLRGAAGRKLARHREDERKQAENLHAGRNKMDIKDGLNCREDFSCQRLMETFSHNTERGMEAPLSQQSRWSWQPFQRRAEMCIVAQLSALSQPLRPLPE